MEVRLLLGPAGSGKTFRCLTEAREVLAASPEGAPLVWVAPKQSTYELERLLLEAPEVPGYTRLQILSFERLAHFIFEALGLGVPDMLNEEGRVMVLRGLLASARDELKLFRASARLTGFAQQLSQLFTELQRNQLTPEALCEAAASVSHAQSLALKLQDFATVLTRYGKWLAAHRLQDSESLLAGATNALAAGMPSCGEAGCKPALRFHIERLWVDGFAEIAPQERELLAELLPHCGSATITFCLDQVPRGKSNWLSTWSAVRRSFEQFKARLQSVPGAEVRLEVLQRRSARNRFEASPGLAQLEEALAGRGPGSPVIQTQSSDAPCVRLVTCSSPETEAVFAAREIVRHVRAGGRYREVTVLVRNLENYYLSLQRVFARYDIPLFVDHREVVSHHPLPELTRSALRTVSGGWQREDWFAALKTGLVPAAEEDLDRLENEALARGWDGTIWLQPLTVPDDTELTAWVRKLQTQLLPPFKQLALALAVGKGKLTGPELAAAIAEFWTALEVEEQLRAWAADELASRDSPAPVAVHATVWEQMNLWLSNVALGFADEALSVPEWLPILEAGLGTLTVGLIPPALDQVLVGTIDRSRNPESKLVLVLGVNEGVFPAHVQAGVLLTESDRVELEERGLRVCDTARHHLARERYYAYVAWTRPRERLVVTCAGQDADGKPLNPSPYFCELAQRFPEMARETFDGVAGADDCVHACESSVPLLTKRPCLSEDGDGSAAGSAGEVLPPELVEALYGRVLRSSVSRIEEYAACPFQFFMRSGLKAEERRKFELDVKEQGSFQHDVLALFHHELQKASLRWRDINPAEARERIERSAQAVAASYGHGLLRANEQARFLANVMTSSLQDFVAVLVAWMREQYQFDPVLVEWPFGRDETGPGWAIDLGAGHSLELQGRIDRVDIFRPPDSNEVFCVVVDYKSGQKKLDPLFLAHGIQLQLLTYLNVLRHSPANELNAGGRLIPCGAFYVPLSGKQEKATTRTDALSEIERAKKLAYRHTGRFDRAALRYLDSRANVTEGDQFNFLITDSGDFYRSGVEAMPSSKFLALLNSTEEHIKRMGREIFAGTVKPAPYRRGATTPCTGCSYQAVCRIDTWTHSFRVLRHPEHPAPARPGRAAPEDIVNREDK